MTGYFISKHGEENHSVYVYDLKNKFPLFLRLDDLEEGKYQLITFTNYNTACNYVANMMSNREISPEDFSRILVINCEEIQNEGE